MTNSANFDPYFDDEDVSFVFSYSDESDSRFWKFFRMKMKVVSFWFLAINLSSSLALAKCSWWTMFFFYFFCIENYRQLLANHGKYSLWYKFKRFVIFSNITTMWINTRMFCTWCMRICFDKYLFSYPFHRFHNDVHYVRD